MKTDSDPATIYDLDKTIQDRRSVRGFIPGRPVPRQVLLEALELAQRAPSNCNVQPWRLYIASAQRCGRLRMALTDAIQAGETPSAEDPIDKFIESYRKLQIECAVSLYKEMSVDRNDHEGRARASLRNFEFFDAPHVAIVCMEKQFGIGVALDVGTYVQTLLLALWARGVATCAQAALRHYPQIIRRELQIPDNLKILCGIALGYEDTSVPANRCRQTRQPIEENVVFLDE